MDSRTSGSGSGGANSRAYFEQQREVLVGDIAESFEHVLANINKLNRSLEAVIAVGNEFSSVEALWSQFENVMAKDDADEQQDANKAAASQQQQHDDDTQQQQQQGGDDSRHE